MMLRSCASRSLFALHVIFSCTSVVLVSSDAVVEHSLANVSDSEGLWATDFEFQMGPGHVTVHVTDIPPASSFSVFHIHIFPKTSYVIVFSPQNSVTLNGTDLGFVHPQTLGPVNFFINNIFLNSISVLVSVRSYNNSYPVPGGCALEFPTKVAPYLMIETGNETITIKGQKGADSFNDQLCLNNDLEYEFYYIYTSESYENAADHFMHLRTMLNYTEIVEKAYKASWMDGSPTQRVFGKYPGVCAYYTMAVKGPLNNVALYSPTSSLLCLQNDGQPLSFGRKALIGSLIPIGMILCFRGNTLFHTSVFFTTFFAGQSASYVGFISTGFSTDDALTYATYAALAIAGIFAFVLVFLYCPIVLITIPILAAMYLVVAVVFYLFLGNIAQFSSGPNYWGVVIASVLFLAGLSAFLLSGGLRMLSFSMIGGFLISYVIDYIWGTKVKYVTINPIRRLTVEGFNSAITSPPLETSDILVFVLWIGLATAGFVNQQRRARGKAPLPPPPRLPSFTCSSEERRPILNTTTYG